MAEEKKTTLEEAAERGANEYYFDNGCSPFPNTEKASYISGFFAGAKWQKEQDDKETADLLAIAHLQGMEQQKREMMKEAVEAYVNTYGDLWAESVVEMPTSNIGDKVKIIIVKSDD